MKRIRFVSMITCVVVLGGILAWRSTTGYTNSDTGDSSPKDPIQDLVSGLATALGASLRQGQFQEGPNQELLPEALATLAVGSKKLLGHGEDFGKSTEHLREAMSKEARQALADFNAGQVEGAKRRVHQLLEYCFACHTRLPEPGRSDLGRRIALGVRVKELELEEQVLFLVAARQFDKTLTTIEAALRSPGGIPTRTTWLFESYLKLSIRVNRSLEKPRDALQEFLEVSDRPRCLRARVRTWIQVLGELENRGALAVNLSTARMLIDDGRRRNEFPADNRGLVHFVAASSVLQRILENQDVQSMEQAQAYSLLGVAESHISSALWTDQTEFFLETAIRIHPHSQLAMRAYSFLQEYVVIKYSSASRTFVPESVWTHLDSLRALAEPAGATSRM